MKTFSYKVYNQSGSFISTWNDASPPEFSWNINGGYSDMHLTLARPITNFGEGFDVNIFNEVQCWVADADTAYAPIKVYSGWIGDYAPVAKGAQESVDVHLMPYTTELTDNLWLGSGSTSFGFTAYDPAAMVQNALDNKHRTVGGKIGSQSSNAEFLTPTGIQISYGFIAQTYRQAIDTAKDISPAGTYWYIDADNDFHFSQRSASPIHTFTVGRDIADMKVTKDAKDIRNVAVGTFAVSNGIPLYYIFGSDSGAYDGSKIQYGKRTAYFNDGRINNPLTAKSTFLNYLDYYAAPLVTATVTLADNSVDTNGYDLESIIPGQTARIVDPFRNQQLTPLGSYVLDFTPLDASIDNLELLPMQIASVAYTLDTATVTMSSRAARVDLSEYEQAQILTEYITQNAPGGITVIP